MSHQEAMAWVMGSVVTCGLLLPVLAGRIIYVWITSWQKRSQEN